MLRDIINKGVVGCSRDSDVGSIARKMKEEDVGAVLVCEGEKPIGIITDRDLVLRCLAEGKDPKSCKASDVMTETLDCVSADDGIYDVIAVMRDHEIRRVPVVDADGNAIGIVSHGDIIALLGRELHDLSLASTEYEPIEDRADEKLKKAA